MLTGLLEPSRGTVQFNGRNIQEDLAGYRARLGYVPEEAHLYPYLTGWEYLEMIGTLRGMDRNPMEGKLDRCCSCFPCIPAATPALGRIRRG